MMKLCTINLNKSRTGCLVQVVEHLTCMCKALVSNLSIEKNLNEDNYVFRSKGL
jgi:hypothetical protein